MTDEENTDPLDDFPGTKEFFADSDHIRVVDELSLDVVLVESEKKINEEGWDQRPILAFIRGNALGVETAEMNLPEEVSANLPVYLPKFVAEMAQYINVYGTGGPYGEFLTTLQEDFLGPAFQGIILSTEGWTVLEPNKDAEPDKWIEWNKAYREGRFHEHQDRVETRITALITPESDFYHLTRVRDGETKYAFQSGENWTYGQMGAIPETLRLLMRCCVSLQALQGLVNDATTAYWVKETQKLKDQSPMEGDE